METWPDDLLKSIKELMWSQWSALGAYLTVEPTRRSLVDPEALVVATCAFGRWDARLFDETMDWISVNNRLIKPWRLKRIARPFGPEVQGTLGAAMEYISNAEGEDLFAGVREEALSYRKRKSREALFQSERLRYSDSEEGADPVFLRWGFLRGTPRIRGHSGKPDLENPANLMIRLRDYYGTGTRADVTAYLLTAGGGSSNKIASRIKYNQKGVYDALERMSESGTVQKYSEVKNAHYWVDELEMYGALGLEGELPEFFVWGDIYLAYHRVVSDYFENEDKYADEFLSAERMRDLTLSVVPLLRNSGEALSRLPVPDVKRQSGSQHRGRLVDYLEAVMETLLTFN